MAKRANKSRQPRRKKMRPTDVRRRERRESAEVERLAELAAVAHRMAFTEPPGRLYHANDGGLQVGDRIRPGEGYEFSASFDASEGYWLKLTPDYWDAIRHTLYFDAPAAVYVLRPTRELTPETGFNLLSMALPAPAPTKVRLPQRWLCREGEVAEVVGAGLSQGNRDTLDRIYREVAVNGTKQVRNAEQRVGDKGTVEMMAALASALRDHGARLGLDASFVDMYARAAETTALRSGPAGLQALSRLERMSQLSGEEGNASTERSAPLAAGTGSV
jgi:hypothetical protein